MIKKFSPAKINLFLAITGKRPDGYHDLLSLIVPVLWGDYVYVQRVKGPDEITCNMQGIPTDKENLVFKAINLFRSHYPFKEGVSCHLEKAIRAGAGLGGGSSNAVSALKGLNELFGEPLDYALLLKLALQLGSDCPFFLNAQSAILKGRGENLTPLPEPTIASLKHKKIVIFVPHFSISTAWAYKKLAQTSQDYICFKTAQRKMTQAIKKMKWYNHFEEIIFSKYIVYAYLKAVIHKKWNVDIHLSGSGSACFFFPPDRFISQKLVDFICQVLGKKTFVIETEIK